MKVFTVVGSANFAGATISQIPFFQQTINGISVGSTESGCRLGILRILGETKGNNLIHCEIEVSSGKAFLRQAFSSKDDSRALLVLKTPVMKGGRNFHTGDRKNAVCLKCEIEYHFMKDECSCGRKLKAYYKELECDILTTGTVRDSKKPIYGEQIICIAKKGQIIRTAYDGYSFGKPGSHYHMFNGKEVITQSWEDRKRRPLF